ncbi:MAG: VWA domain-containing protein, partial [Alphaproteobacteria bacterium]|nr:VWA domain-containing protein [Alphaproteobacteria bacterium]
MFEIFSVLAIMAFLSILTLLGYRYAVQYHHATEIIGTANVERTSALVSWETNKTFTDASGKILDYGWVRSRLSDDTGFYVTVENIPGDVCAQILKRRWDAPDQYVVDEKIVNNFDTSVCYDENDKPRQITMSFVFGWAEGSSFIPSSECDLTEPCYYDYENKRESEQFRVLEDNGLCTCKCPEPNSMYDSATGKCECEPPQSELTAGACVCPSPKTYHDEAKNECVCDPDTTPTGADPDTCACPAVPHVYLTSGNKCITCADPKIVWDAANEKCVCDPGITCPADKKKNADCDCVCDPPVTCSEDQIEGGDCDCVCDPAVVCPGNLQKDAACKCRCLLDCSKNTDGKTFLDAAKCACACDPEIECPEGRKKDENCQCSGCSLSCANRADGKTRLDSGSCACVCPVDMKPSEAGVCCPVDAQGNIVMGAEPATLAARCCRADEEAVARADGNKVCCAKVSGIPNANYYDEANRRCVPLGYCEHKYDGVAFIIDNSGSMSQSGKLTKVKNAIKGALAKLPAKMKVGVYAFTDSASTKLSYGNHSVLEIEQAVSGMGHYGVTCISCGLDVAWSNTYAQGHRPILIVFSDGLENRGDARSKMVWMKSQCGNLRAYSVGLSKNPILGFIATGGGYFTQTSADGVSGIFSRHVDNDLNCLPQPNRMICDSTSITNVSCGAGFYQQNGVCTTCPSHSTCNGIVFACDTEYYKDSNTSCRKCPSGATCTAVSFTCNPGYYKDSNTSCDNCPSNATCTAVSFTCNPGYYTNTAETGCTKCQAGYACPGGSTRTQCTAGYYAASGASSCTPCPGGKWQKDARQSSCDNCPSNATCAGTGNTTFVCNSGYYRASATATACTRCQTGYACPGGSAKTQCTAGYYAAAGSSSCTACPSGKWQKDAGQGS